MKLDLSGLDGGESKTRIWREANLQYLLGELYLKQKRWRDSETALGSCLVRAKRALGKEHPFIGRILYLLGRVYRGSDRPEKAESYFRRALRTQEESVDPREAQATAELRSTTVLATTAEAEGPAFESEGLLLGGLQLSAVVVAD